MSPTSTGALESRDAHAKLTPSLFEALVRDNADMVAVIDLEGRFVFASDAVRWTLGREPDWFIGRDGFEIIHPDDLGSAAESLASTVASGSGVREPLLLRLLHADGTWRAVEILTNNLSGDERVHGLVITARDMSARRQSELTAIEARDLFEQAFTRAPIGMAIVGNDGELRRVNHALATMIGSTIQTMIGQNLINLAHAEDQPGALSYARDVFKGKEPPAFEVRFVRLDGDIAWARVTASLIRCEDGSPLHSVVQIEDVTEQHRLRDELKRAATHDPLTGLLNRAGLEESYERFERRSGNNSAVLLIDLDRFKPVNDTFGHHAGDRLLQFVAARLREALRGGSVIARIGGDEFVAHIEGVTDAEQAVGVAERVRRTLASPFVVSGNRINIAGSIGVVYMETSVDLEDALACSDRASYLAKRSGGDQVSLCSPGSKEG
ncbi:MAG: diguanylate cyclase [Microthrixaceae bacterium]|nr:diguanylate cyclase [Microthrixaceae bacterium]